MSIILRVIPIKFETLKPPNGQSLTAILWQLIMWQKHNLACLRTSKEGYVTRADVTGNSGNTSVLPAPQPDNLSDRE